jgi:uncharacterized protein (TIGR02678 family)
VTAVRSNTRLAVHVPPHQLPELQRAARALLRGPLITTRSAEEFRLVLRWETVLRNEFAQKLGYRLDVSRSAARLLRRPAALTVHRGARLHSGKTLGRLGYVYLCLCLAALEQPGHQLIASELVSRIVNLARGDDRIRIDTTEYVQRRALRDAVRYLEQLGVLTVRDGDVDSLLTEGQVLWDIDRDAAAMCMVAAPSILRSVQGVGDFISDPVPTAMDARNRRARHLLNRRVLSQSVVLHSDLDPDESELAWRNRRREAENLTRLTGCEIELRREGLALIDHPTDPIGAARFPGGSSVTHAALLWLTELVELAAPAGPPGDGGDEGAGEVEPWRIVDAPTAASSWDRVMEEHSERFAGPAREQPEVFRLDVESLLERFRLVSRGDDGSLAVNAFASRYRAVPTVVDGNDDGEPAEVQGTLL